ncbi:hypothetical protein TVAG_090250 [Trichomonas vaginalis G3]|uniref:Uncharacterized protein n=1 Tax=Trichomonas vaginalis (strain ATCC PRA-98 / G3) TaxID=412133 RepID=A2EZQ2_TRIV3|nr:hypothetical protein TVAGG3_0186620 [Trichomonas vaginalis G3]EAY01890.1 hypothetical protein TVAG_090250 [Trichomonas vaginalis G3]KAI5549687.1 hypothetical protein TVAGG3_0186620 [Trichomonas vaginalis G3]|eukprot:XP_001330433.1 hypothetical protein [Trichomonas vaginalis G3]
MEDLNVLFADLNLVVEANNKTYLGNLLPRSTHEEFTNVERVLIKDLDPQDIIIHVYSNDFYLENDNLEFSLSIYGGFDTSNENCIPFQIQREDDNKICPGNCSGYDCDNGWCKCNEIYRGLVCQHKMRLLEDIQQSNRLFTSMDTDVNYLYFNLPIYNKFRLRVGTDWHTDWVNHVAVVVTDDIYGISGHSNKYIFPTNPQHYGTYFLTDWISLPYNKTYYVGIYNFRKGESHGRLRMYLQYNPTPHPTPELTPTPLPTPTPHPTQTPFVTPIQTFRETPFYTEKMTPFETAFETVFQTPYLTPLSTTSIITPLPTQTLARTVFIEKPDNEKNSKNSKVKNKEIIGIVVGIIAVVGLIVVACLLLLRKKKKGDEDDDVQTPVEEETKIQNDSYLTTTISENFPQAFLFNTDSEEDDDDNITERAYAWF